MNTSRSILAVTLGTLIALGMPLAQAAPGPDNHSQGGPQQHNQGHDGNGHGEANGHSQNGQHGNQQPGARPPQDFGPVRDTIREHRTDFGRGTPLPPGVQIAKGHPLPKGYGHRLDRAALSRLPHYEGYEWRRLGTDVVLIAVGSGIVYEILNGVLQ
jgi:Ni/Co efflux regulator RcnB